VSQHKEQCGFVTFAQNTTEVDYLELAYLQCLNIKATQKNNRYAVIVDAATKEKLDDRHRNVFDYIIDLPCDYNDPTSDRKFFNEWQVFSLTPFKETIKLEADLLFTRTIDHWWTAFRLKNVCLSTDARTYRGTGSAVRKYRQLFDDNNLPDVYNGLMYFRYTREAADFFNVAKLIFEHWDLYREELQNCVDDEPTTDVVYAIASLVSGPDSVTTPSLDFINFVHMKSGFNGWSDTRSWLETVMTERDGDVIRINNCDHFVSFLIDSIGIKFCFI
jgi:hypothetical protein